MTEVGSSLLRFLEEEAIAADKRFRYLSSLLSSEPSLPTHILDTLQNLRQHAEEDYSNCLHLQSVLPPTGSRKLSPVKRSEAAAAPAEAIVEERGSAVLRTGSSADSNVETGVAAGDDVFLLEGVEAELTMSPESATTTFSDGEGEESEADEGIHLPRKHHRPAAEIAASLPVGIPWPAELASLTRRNNGGESGAKTRRFRRAVPLGDAEDDDDDLPQDIAASIQAMARSVHTSSMFGDSVFGDLPRPRLNTLSNV